jgi:copper oxidase (laccase) domain-containing protein
MNKGPEEKYYRQGFFKKMENFPLRNGISNFYMGDFGIGGQSWEEMNNQHRRLLYVLEGEIMHRLVPQHGSKINYGGEGKGINYIKGDALITLPNEEKTVLACSTGDCPILLLTDSGKDFAAIIHCGWKSIKEKAIPKTLNIVKKSFFLNQVQAGLFPGICVGCYEVTRGFAEGYFDNYILPNNKIDLKEIIVDQLIDNGIDKNKIQKNNYCSAHETSNGGYLYYSHRRDGNGKRNIVFCVI